MNWTGRPRAGLSFACLAGRAGAEASGKFFRQALELNPEWALVALVGCWNTNMRATALGLIFCTVALPCLAQTVLKSEPLMLAPYEVAFVQDASCPVGKVLKVTGAIRGLNRKKVCVTLGLEQATLSAATP
jgi:hypothetical protein